MAVNAKLGVDLTSFESGIRTGQSILKGLKAEMKATEAEFKATGNSEQLLANKTKVLNSQLQAQKGIADQAKQALKAMDDAGVEPTEAAYQKLYATMMNANAGMYETQAALTGLDSTAQEAASSAENLTNSVNGIGKKISLDQVINGIGKITSGLENAAKKAVDLGKQIWDSIMNSARWADDTATMAQMYGIDVDTFQRMQKLVTNGMDTSVEAMLQSQSKFKKGIGDGTKAVTEAMSELGLTTREWQTVAGESGSSLMPKDATELFWEAGQAIMNLGDEFEKESKAQALFGKSWKELVPLFSEYKTLEEYNAALADQKVVSEDSVKNLAELNDKVSELQGNFMTLSTEVIGQLAPALTNAANALNGLLTSLLEYLETDEGKQMLQDLGTAVSGLFDDLKKIDPEDVVKGFTDVFNTVVGSIQWLSDNWEGVVTALESILIGWGALKVTGGILDIVKVISGIQGITSSGAATAGAAAGSAWGGAFAKAVIAAAPWLIGLYTLMNPAGTANNNIDTLYQNGQITEAGMEFWNNNKDVWQARQKAVGDRYGDLGSLMSNAAALQIMLDTTINDEEMFKRLEEELGLTPIDVNVDPVVGENAAADIAEQIGPVYIPIIPEPTGRIRTPKGWVYPEDGQQVNGLWSVPYDGYLARLHKDERVVPAREVQSRSYSSNLYVESMYMNGGTDAAGLAAAMAAAQRRQMSGYGS